MNNKDLICPALFGCVPLFICNLDLVVKTFNTHGLLFNHYVFCLMIF